MVITWDEKGRGIYIYLDDEDCSRYIDITRTKQVSDNINIDYSDGKVVGIEIFDISEPTIKKIG